mmetsp:Transcript_41504/g.100801  ORF Transcript_41504/g.100801 Transcript_41504/m.100801 type:complete len:248 (-) Transcript_41504:628-1371(-)
MSPSWPCGWVSRERCVVLSNDGRNPRPRRLERPLENSLSTRDRSTAVGAVASRKTQECIEAPGAGKGLRRTADRKGVQPEVALFWAAEPARMDGMLLLRGISAAGLGCPLAVAVGMEPVGKESGSIESSHDQRALMLATASGCFFRRIVGVSNGVAGAEESHLVVRASAAVGLSLGSKARSWRTNCAAALETSSHASSSNWEAEEHSVHSLSSVGGKEPQSRRYAMQPMAQMSTFMSYWSVRISGAT